MANLLLFDKINKRITVPKSYGREITIQNLHNEIVDWEDELVNLEQDKVVSSAGKEPLGGGVTVGITLTLLNDWQLAFEEGTSPVYDQCKVSGGNLVATNVLGAIYPTAFTQVLITASSSATLQELSSIQFSSFNGGVTVDPINGTDGTSFPIGTLEQPVKGLTDAMTIATTRGFNKLFIVGDMTIDAGGDYSNMQFYGDSMTSSTLTIDTLANVENCQFFDATITGTLDGNARIENCIILDLNYINGAIQQCMLGNGTITLGGSDEAHFLDCWSGVAGLGTPTINMGGSGQALAIRNYNGGITITNKTGTDKVSIDLNSGQVVFDNTVAVSADDQIVVRGIGKLTDNSTGVGTINDTDLLNRENISEATWDEAIADHTMSDTFGKVLTTTQTDAKKAAIFSLLGNQ